METMSNVAGIFLPYTPARSKGRKASPAEPRTNGGNYFVDWTQGVPVSRAKHLALKASLQFQYSHQPALENVDVIARVILVDPDSIHGDGYEVFETVDKGGIKVTVGQALLRKSQIESTFRSSLLISF